LQENCHGSPDSSQSDWQNAFWGPNYPRLLEIKRRGGSEDA
jgi:Berberine and berberine like